MSNLLKKTEFIVIPDSGDESTVNKNCIVKDKDDDSKQDENLIQEKKNLKI